jgi:hypothetical protein
MWSNMAVLCEREKQGYAGLGCIVERMLEGWWASAGHDGREAADGQEEAGAT